MTNISEGIALADEQLLAELGYKQEFRRAFSPVQVFGVAFSIIGLLPSIASVLFYPMQNGGPVSMVWGWAVMSAGIMLVGLSMAELASAAPTSGGLYFWTFSLSSPRYRNILCWIVGYANTIGSIAAVASIDWGAASQIGAAISIGSNGAVEATNAQLFGIYAAIVITHAILCGLATPVLAKLQTVYVILNILLCLAVIIALPISTPAENMNSVSFAFGGFENVYGWPDGFAFLLAGLAPLWTICSFDSTVHISEEASNAATAVPWAIVSAIGIAGVLGWAINVSLAFCMGPDVAALAESEQPMADIFLQSFGPKGTLAIWAFVVIVQYMMGSSMLLSASRQTFAFARDGALPLSSLLYKMNTYTGTPVNTVWFCAFWSVILGLLAFVGEGQAINAVFTISVTALYIAYAIPICAKLVGRGRFKAGPFDLGVLSVPVGVTGVSFMALMGIVFLFPSTPATTVQDMNYAVVVTAGVLVLSLAWYFCPKYGGRYWFTGPVRTVETMGPVRTVETMGVRYESGESDESAQNGPRGMGTRKGDAVRD